MRIQIAALWTAGIFLATSLDRSSANPIGGTVVGGPGNATISGSGTPLTTINQTANRAVINWQDFSIRLGEVTRFVQPSSTAIALNRVVSGNPSTIYGSLLGNGQVFVINPNGILVGASGKIDTKGFMASTLDIKNDSFLSGSTKLTLSGDSTASVRNEGSISALGGDVFLIGHTVENAGTISAAQGTVGLAAGSEVRLALSGNERLTVVTGNSSAAKVDNGVNNQGTVEAASVELKAAGGNLYALAINNGGVVRATSVVNENGHIYLRANGGNIQNSGTLSAKNADGSGGTIVVDGGHNASSPSTVINSGTIEARGDASGTKGGEVQLLGDHVGLVDHALVDVSGDSGGGKVLIGGGYQGSNPDVRNADATYAGPDVHIRADALSVGDGGRVIVWSDTATRFYGLISARGGSQGGNGGFIETSGKAYLDVSGASVDGSAVAGQHGTWLLDPHDITLDGATTSSPGYTPVFTATVDNSHVNVGQINGSLNAGTDVTISTGATGSQNGDINVNAAVAKTSGNSTTSATLTLNAAGSININNNGTTTLGSIANTTAADLNVVLNAGQNVALNGSVDLGSHGTLGITAGGNIIQGGSGVIVAISGASTFTIDGGVGKDISVANAGNRFANQLVTFSAINGGSIHDLSFRNIASTASFGQLAPLPTGLHNLSITFDNAGMTVPVLTVGGTLTLSAGDAIAMAQNVTAGAVSVWSGTDGSGDLDFSAGVTIKASSQSYRAGDGTGTGAAGAAVHMNPSVTTPTFLNTLGTASPDSFIYRQDHDIADINIPHVAAGDDRFGGFGAPAIYSIISDGGDVTLSTAAKVAGSALTLSAAASGGTLQINTALNGLNSLVSLNASGGTIVLNAAGTTLLPTIQTSAGQTYNGPVTLLAATVLQDTGGQDITFASGSTINGARTLEVDTTGNVALRSVGGSTRLTGLTVNANTLTLNGNISTQDGAVDFTGVSAVSLGNAVIIDTDSVQDGGVAGAITFGAATTINGAQSLTLDAFGQGSDLDGNVTLGVVGGTTRLTGLTARGGTLTLNGNISTEGGLVDLTTFIAVSLANNVTIDTDSVQDGTAAGAITFGATTPINGAHTLTLDARGQGTDVAGNLALGVVGGSTRLTGLTAKGGTLTLNGNISTEDGLVDLTGLSAVSLANNITIDTDSTQDGGTAGAINFGAATTINGAHILTLDASGEGTDGSANVALGIVGGSTRLTGLTAKGSTLTLNGNISTQDGAVDFTGVSAVSLGNNVTIDTDNSGGVAGAITFGAATTINGAHTLTLDAGSSGTSGNLALGVVGGVTRLTGLTAKGNTLTLNGNISTEDGLVDFTGVSAVSLANSVTIDTDSTQDGGAAGAINFGAATTINGAQTLTLDARGQGSDGSGNLALGVVGGSTRLTGLTAKGNTLTLNGNISTEDGLVDFTGLSAVTLANNITIDTDSTQDGGTAGAINFGAATTINGARTLTLDASGQGTDGFGNVALGEVGNSTRLTGLTVKGNTLTLNGDISTEAGAVDLTGVSAISLGNNATIDTDSVQDGSAAGAINFGLATTINGFNTLTLDTRGQGSDGSGDLTMGVVGNLTPLAGLTLRGKTLTLNGTVILDTGVGVLDLNGSGDINFNANVTANSVTAHSGNDGSGDIFFAAGLTVKADAQSYQAGDGTGGGGTTARANLLVNNPVFLNSAGGAAPNSFTFRQDADIANTDIPNIAPGAYTIESDDGGVTLPAMNLPGTLTVVAQAQIAQAAALSVFGLASFTSTGSGVNGNIALNLGGNNFGSVALNSANGNLVSLTEASDTALDTVAVNAGDLTINSGGVISQVPGKTITVGGLGSFTSSGFFLGGNIVLDNAGNNFGSVSLNSFFGSALSVTEASDTALDAVLTVVGTVTINSAGAISQVAGKTITASGLGSFTSTGAGANGSITLDNVGNNFGSVLLSSANGTAVSVTEGSDTVLDTVAVNNGTLTINSAGAISQAAGKTVTVGGLGSFTSTGLGVSGNITLDNAGNNFGSLLLSSANGTAVSVTEASGTALDTVAVNAGSLTINSAGAISQVAGKTLIAGGLASFTSTGVGVNGDIALDNAGNNFGSVTLNSATGTAVSLTEASDTALDAVGVNSGSLTINSAGAISQVAGRTVTVGGLGSFTSTGVGASGNIALDNAGNNFGSLGLVSVNGTAVSATEASSTALDTVGVNNGALTINSAGAISQVAGKTVNVNGLGSFTSTGVGANGNITLDNAGNNFGSIALSSANGTAVSATEASSTALDIVAVNAGSLTINSAGAIDQVAGKTVTVGGLGSFTSTGVGANGNITLDNAGNNFGSLGLVSVNGTAVSATEASGTALDTVGVNNGVLTINSAGAISQVASKTINVNGLGSFTSTGVGANGNIALDNAGNNFGSIALSSANGTAVSATEASSTALDTVAVNNGALTISSAGAISQVAGKTVTVGGLGAFTSTGAGANGNITLDNAGNNFGSLGLVSANGTAVSATEASSTALDTVAVNNGALTINSAGAISQVAGKTVTVGGLGSFTSTGVGANGNITLDNAGNNFGSVLLVSANGTSVSVTEASSTALDTMNVGSLTINSAGAISQLAGKTLTVSGLGSFTSTGVGANGNITLDNAGNNFGSLGLVSANGTAVSATEASGTALDTVAVNNGSLTISSAGAISQVGGRTVTVGGLGSFTSTGAGANGNITLDNAGNNFGSVLLNSANGTAVSLTEASSTALDSVTVNAGTLAINSAGAISQVAGKTVKASGLASFTSTGAGANGDVVLNNAGNNFGSLGLVSANGAAVSVTEASSTALDTVAVNAGSLTVNSVAAISQVAGKSVTVGGLGAFTSTGAGANGNITLNNAGNNFGSLGLVSANGTAVTATEASSTALDTVAVNNGSLTVNSAGAISQVAGKTVNVNGLASFNSFGFGANGNIALDNSGNNFGSVRLNSANGAAVSLTEASSTALDTVAVNAGSLAINSAGAVSQVAGKSVNVAGLASFWSSGAGANGNIALNSAGNNFGAVGLNSANGAAVSVTEASSTALDTVAVNSGVLTVNSAGAISQVAGKTVNVNGLGSFTSSGAGAGGDIALDNAGNNFGSVALSSASGSAVSVTEASGTALDTVSANSGTLAVTSGGDITQVSGKSITVGGATTFTAPAGNSVTVANVNGSGSPVNTFNGPVSFVASGFGNLANVIISDTTGFDIAAVTVDGTLAVNSGGEITQSGNISANALEATAVTSVNLGPGTSDAVSWPFANHVNTLAGKVTGSGGTFSFIDQSALTVGEVNGVSGITTLNGNVTLTADKLEISNPINSGDNRLFGVTVLLQPLTTGRNLNLGSEDAGSLSLKQSELNEVTSAVLQVGNVNAGSANGVNAIQRPLTVDILDVVGNGSTIQVLAGQLASLSAVTVPGAKLDSTTFTGSEVSSEEAGKILPSGSIGTLWLQLPFEHKPESTYRIEEMSKWTSGRVAAAGTTTGPQSPK